MKKFLPFILWCASLFSIVHGAYDTPISCSDSRVSASAGSCNVCYSAGSLYYRSDIPIENKTNFFDEFFVNTGTRLLWQDETTVIWNQLNNDFTLGSSLAANRSDPNGFKFQVVPGGWNTAQNAPNTGRVYGFFSAGTTARYVASTGGISLNNVLSTATPADRNTAMWRIVFNAASHEYIWPGQQGPKVDHNQCAFVFPRWCGDGVTDTDKGEICDDGNMTNGDGCSNLCQYEPQCTSVTLAPTTLTVVWGTLRATCAGSNLSVNPKYSFILREGMTPIGSQTGYSTSNFYDFTIPTNTTANIRNYSVQCYIESGTTQGITQTPQCVAGLTQSANTTASIDIVKSHTSGADTQAVMTGGTANFRITVTNPGPALTNVVITDALSGGCAQTAAQTAPRYSGGATANFDTGESFTYDCTQTNVTSATFPNNINTAVVTANPISNTNQTVTDTDPTTITFTTTPSPQISITKNDADNSDDTQQVISGGTATFTIVATNTGTEALTNVTIIDALSNNCDKIATQTASLYAGGTSTYFDPGESFSYTCTKTGVTSGTFPNNINTINISGVGINSNQTVTSTDPTTITIQWISSVSCDSLSTSISGNTVSYTCSATNATSWSIQLNGSQIGTNAAGSVTLNNGTHILKCTINNGITSSACEKTITINTNTLSPQISVTKDDNDNHDDQQQVSMGGTAQFTITVRNTGNEVMENVSLSDQFTPECNRNTGDTMAMIRNTGNGDTYFNPGESFSYICTKNAVNQYTFPGNENRICVAGKSMSTGSVVNGCDVTRILTGSIYQNPVCEHIQVSQNNNQITASCGPESGYRLYVLQGKQVINTFQDPTGHFLFNLNNGNYKIACVRDGEREIQATCQKNIAVGNTRTNACNMKSGIRYGWAPLQTTLTCETINFSSCTMQIVKNGEPWQTINDCASPVTFTEQWTYEATCLIDSGETCSTTIEVDIMTIIRTGPLPIVLLLSIIGGAYITYRRRKAA
jgi:uncharacterized repeat protein (TIGR01451 family)